MRDLVTMAVDESKKENLSEHLQAVAHLDGETNNSNKDENHLQYQNLSFSYLKNREEVVNSSKKGIEDALCSSRVVKRKQTDLADKNASERNIDDTNQSSGDSLSSSASMTDSDLTSTDSDDSLALSESESITDVTPLNSPYCDSPLSQSRLIDYKSEDKVFADVCKNDTAKESSHHPEMNVLMKAIEKLELEAKNNTEYGIRESVVRRRGASFSNEEAKKIELENQRLFKRVISQQNRIRSICTVPGKNISCKNQGLVKSDGDIAVTPKKPISIKSSRGTEKSQAHRKQKCLSHPSSFIYSRSHLIDKSLLTDDLYCEGKEKKKHVGAPGMKITCSQKVGSSCKGVTANSVETK